MTTCDFTKNDTPKFILCWKKGTPKNGTSRTFIYGSYPPPPGADALLLLLTIYFTLARKNTYVYIYIANKLIKANKIIQNLLYSVPNKPTKTLNL